MRGNLAFGAARRQLSRLISPLDRRKRLAPSIGWGVPLALAVVLPIFDRNAGDLDAWANAETFALLALGLNVVLGFAGLLDLGYAAFFALGAYTYGLAASTQLEPTWGAIWGVLARLGQVSQSHSGGITVAHMHFSYWLVVPVAAVICAVVGAALGVPTLRLRGDYVAIVTLGFGEIVPILIRNWSSVTNGSQGLPGVDTPSLFGWSFGFNTVPYYYVMLVFLILGIAASYLLLESRVGRAWRAMRADEAAAQAAGINLVHYKLLAYSIGAAFAAVAGTFYVAKLTTADPVLFGFPVSTSILVLVVFGGIGSIPGVVVGALTLMYMQGAFFGALNDAVHSLGNATGFQLLSGLDITQLNGLFYGAILLIMMLFRRQGLIPATRAVSSHSREDLVVEPQAAGWSSPTADFRPRAEHGEGVPLLAINGLTKRYGGVRAIDNLSIHLQEGLIASVIGPNGSGKTTLFNLISRFETSDAGSIVFAGSDITRVAPNTLCGVGIGRTFQNIRLFDGLSVLENVLVGLHSRMAIGAVANLCRTRGSQRAEREARERALAVLSLFGRRLIPRIDDPVESLSYANRRRTEIARALVAAPRLLLLDEPAAGMNPTESNELMRQIRSLPELGVTVLLIEHKFEMVSQVSDHVIVLNFGRKIAEGTPNNVRSDPAVVDAYLGSRHAGS